MATTHAPGMAIVSAAVPVTMREQLERLAAENDRTLSSEIRRAVRCYLSTRDDEDARTA